LGCLAALSLSCGGYGSICQKAMDCEGGNSNDEGACEETFELEKTLAHDAGCDSKWDDWYQCYQEHATCHGTKQFDATDFCKNQSDALGVCEESLSHGLKVP
jgi:hypothetical protein